MCSRAVRPATRRRAWRGGAPPFAFAAVEGQTYAVVVEHTGGAPTAVSLRLECGFLAEVDCDDGLDDDQNGLTDCADPLCAQVTSCVGSTVETQCEDEVDSDQDGQTDCEDSDCAEALACIQTCTFTPPAVSCGFQQGVNTGSGASTATDYPCGPSSPGPEIAYRFKPQAAGLVTATMSSAGRGRAALRAARPGLRVRAADVRGVGRGGRGRSGRGAVRRGGGPDLVPGGRRGGRRSGRHLLAKGDLRALGGPQARRRGATISLKTLVGRDDSPGGARAPNRRPVAGRAWPIPRPRRPPSLEGRRGETRHVSPSIATNSVGPRRPLRAAARTAGLRRLARRRLTAEARPSHAARRRTATAG
jgi:hypothetical protein